MDRFKDSSQFLSKSARKIDFDRRARSRDMEDKGLDKEILLDEFAQGSKKKDKGKKRIERSTGASTRFEAQRPRKQLDCALKRVSTLFSLLSIDSTTSDRVGKL